MVWQNIQSHDLFTDRFIRIALGEIIYCRTFFAQLRTVFEKTINCWIFPLNWTELRYVFDITCAIGDFRAYIFCPPTTQELPKKHHEAGSSEQLPHYALSQTDYGHTGHC